MAMTLHEIANLTNDNMHTEAYIQGCLYIGLPENGYMIGALRDIEKRHNERGELSWKDSKNRYALYQDMMNMAKLIMGEGEYKEFYGSF